MKFWVVFGACAGAVLTVNLLMAGAAMVIEALKPAEPAQAEPAKK